MSHVYRIKPPAWRGDPVSGLLAGKSSPGDLEVCLEAADVEGLRAKGYEVWEVAPGVFSKSGLDLAK